MSTYDNTGSVNNICFNDSKLYVVTDWRIVKINISDNSVYQKTDLGDESGDTITGGHCAIMSNYLYLLDESNKKIYKFNLSDL